MLGTLWILPAAITMLEERHELVVLTSDARILLTAEINDT
jgi:hypothetical protein